MTKLHSSGENTDPKVEFQKPQGGPRVLPKRGAAERARAIKLRLRLEGRTFSDSTQIIRADRDGRT